MSTELQTQTQEITPMLSFVLSIDGKNQAFLADPDNVYHIVAAGIRKQLGGNTTDTNAPEEQKALVRLVRVSVRGALIAFGGKILDMVFRSKDHPRPGKKDDLIEWYSDMFAKIAITEATRGTILIQASGGNYGQEQPLIVDQVRPFSLAQNTKRIDGIAGERVESGPDDTSSAYPG